MAILITWGCKRRGGGRSEEGERRGKKWDERGFCDCLKPISPSIQTEKTETGEIAASSQCSLIQPSLSTSFFSFLLSPLPLLNSKAGWRLTEIGSSTIDEHQHKKNSEEHGGGGASNERRGGSNWEQSMASQPYCRSRVVVQAGAQSLKANEGDNCLDSQWKTDRMDWQASLSSVVCYWEAWIFTLYVV